MNFIPPTHTKQDHIKKDDHQNNYKLFNKLLNYYEYNVTSHGWTEAVDLIIKSMERTIEAKTVTYDFKCLINISNQIKYNEFFNMAIKRM